MKIFSIACGLLVILLVLLNITDALPGGEYADLEKVIKELNDEKLVKIIKDCNTKYTPVKECNSIKKYYECTVQLVTEDCGHEKPEKTLPPTEPPKTKATKKPIIIKPKPKS